MATIPPPTTAQKLLGLLSSHRAGPLPTDSETDKIMSDFILDIAALDQKHNRGKSITRQRLVEQVFGRSRSFKDRRAAIPYLRYQLRTAFEELTQLSDEIKSKGGGAYTYAVVSSFEPIITDYLFDLLEILNPLQANVPGWTFFEGGKNSTVSSWEVYILARGLAYQSLQTAPGKLDHKASQIAAIAVLRQAMELRFQRLIAVYPVDGNGKAPRLRHGFHQDFIASNPALFKTNGFSIKDLRNLYDWTSEIVHQAYQPYTWQISLALRHAGDLLRSQPKTLRQGWSIYNAVDILDVPAMQTAFESHFLASYGHGKWRMVRLKPEAFVPNWKPEMAFTDPIYKPVDNRPKLRARIIRRVKNIISQI